MGLFRKEDNASPGENKQGLSAKELLNLALRPKERAKVLDAAQKKRAEEAKPELEAAVANRHIDTTSPGYKIQEGIPDIQIEDDDPNYVQNSMRMETETKNANEGRNIEEERAPGQTGILIQMSQELNEMSLVVGEEIDKRQEQFGKIRPAVRGLNEASRALSVFDRPIEAMGRELIGRETLASKASREIALEALIEAFTIESQLESGDLNKTEADDLLDSLFERSQPAWNMMSLHSRTKLQKQLTRAIRPRGAFFNLPARLVDSYKRHEDALITPDDTLKDTYDEIRRTIRLTENKRGNYPKFDRRKEGVTATTTTVDLLIEAKKKLENPVVELIDIAEEQLAIADSSLQQLPEGALKSHFLNLVTESSEEIKAINLKKPGNDHTEVLTLITGISSRISVINAVGKGDLTNAAVRLLMRTHPVLSTEISVLAASLQESAKLGMVLGLATEVNVRGLAERVIDTFKQGQEQGLSLNVTVSGESVRGARYNLLVFSERLQEAATQMEALRGSGDDRGLEGLLEGIDGLEEMRHLIPVLRQVGEIAMRGNLDTLGITEDLIPLAEQKKIVDLCVELDQRGESLRTKPEHQTDYTRETMVEDYEGRLGEIQTLGKESLVVILIQNIQDTFNIENEADARALLTEKGWNEWVNRRNNKDVEYKSLLNVTGRLTAWVRTGVREKVGILGPSLMDMYGVRLDDDNPEDLSKATFDEDDNSYISTLGRIRLLQQGHDYEGNSDTFRNDLALARSLKLKLRLGKSNLGEKVRNLLSRNEVLNTHSIKRLEQIQTLMEHGTVVAAEALALVATVLLAKETNQVAGDVIGNTMDNLATQLSSGIDVLKGQLEGATRNADSFARLFQQAKFNPVEIEAVGTPENIEIAQRAAQKALREAAGKNAEDYQQVLDAIKTGINNREAGINVAEGFGRLARRIGDIGHVGLAARIAAIGATVEGLRIKRNAGEVDKLISKAVSLDDTTYIMGQQ